LKDIKNELEGVKAALAASKFELVCVKAEVLDVKKVVTA